MKTLPLASDHLSTRSFLPVERLIRANISSQPAAPNARESQPSWQSTNTAIIIASFPFELLDNLGFHLSTPPSGSTFCSGWLGLLWFHVTIEARFGNAEHLAQFGNRELLVWI